eukprot:gnl/TRDRNA2_/TRDRNA2_177207_c2_seq20.p2 gnl/TRDRNA2_/TRDRNA2_177207_c2~~gnl/TRDRNA2_/TRDRNA2_177207_c2_seq20.p2  ORF type:complete len:109 (-),score=10.78 gnl/TRDRNA2_/TRDRNA2_177207_c2_seq20:333-659(-)
MFQCVRTFSGHPLHDQLSFLRSLSCHSRLRLGAAIEKVVVVLSTSSSRSACSSLCVSSEFSVTKCHCTTPMPAERESSGEALDRLIAPPSDTEELPSESSIAFQGQPL